MTAGQAQAVLDKIDVDEMVTVRREVSVPAIQQPVSARRHPVDPSESARSPFR